MKSVSVSFFAAALALACVACRAEVRQSEAFPAPLADADLPELPPVEKFDRPSPPKDGAIGPNSALVDRFSAEGERVSYRFELEDGEVDFFDIGCFGNARLWHSTVRVRVRDESGHVVREVERDGPVVHHELICVSALPRGEYTLELTAVHSTFRFRLVRHAGFARGACEPLGERASLASYLASSDDTARFTVDAAAGEELALEVLNSEEEARVERRTPHPRRAQDGVYGGWLYPGFDLEVREGSRLVGERGRFVLARFDHAARLTLEVRTHERGDGGRFELHVLRNAHKIAVRGAVRDAEDRPLEGVTLAFVRKPDREAWAIARTRDDGSFDAQVPPGPYELELNRDLVSDTVELNLLEPREVNLIFDRVAAARADVEHAMRSLLR